MPSDITPNPRVTTYVQNSVPYTCDLLNSQVAHTFLELIPSTHRSRPLFILNCYLLPKQPVSELIALIKAASTAAKKDPLIILGDFNCAHVDWGYIRTNKRGAALYNTLQMQGLSIYNDFSAPTRIGNSVSANTSPDLTFGRNFPTLV